MVQWRRLEYAWSAWAAWRSFRQVDTFGRLDAFTSKLTWRKPWRRGRQAVHRLAQRRFNRNICLNLDSRSHNRSTIALWHASSACSTSSSGALAPRKTMVASAIRPTTPNTGICRFARRTLPVISRHNTLMILPSTRLSVTKKRRKFSMPRSTSRNQCTDILTQCRRCWPSPYPRVLLRSSLATCSSSRS